MNLANTKVSALGRLLVCATTNPHASGSEHKVQLASASKELPPWCFRPMNSGSGRFEDFIYHMFLIAQDWLSTAVTTDID